MRWAWLGLVTAVLARFAGHDAQAGKPIQGSSDKSYGTAIDWFTPPDGAARHAADSSKLLMVLHLSGNFAKPEFT
jgi:hypothetical protein